MNCKEGDLALIIKSDCDVNVGKIITCIRLTTKEELDSVSINCKIFPLWLIDRDVEWGLYRGGCLIFTKDMPYMPDSYLMPIRPDEIKEESLLKAMSE